MPTAPKVYRPWKKRIESRPSAPKRGYNRAWYAATDAWIREQFASGTVTCAWCGEVLSGARRDIHVDHIERHNGQADPRFWDRGNWQLLHAGCHSSKTRAEST